MSKTMTAGEGGALLMQDEANWKIVSQRCCVVVQGRYEGAVAITG
jgi:dTDP-4-amino-4,6-dideoxygalactose transaminase